MILTLVANFLLFISIEYMIKLKSMHLEDTLYWNFALSINDTKYSNLTKSDMIETHYNQT